MARYENHDVGEYHLMINSLSLAVATTVAYIPIPASGRIVRIFSCCEVAPSAGIGVTFQLRDLDLQLNGATATLAIPAADIAGDIKVEDFSSAGRQWADEAADGDDTLSGGVLEIISNGAGTATYTFVITIQQ